MIQFEYPKGKDRGRTLRVRPRHLQTGLDFFYLAFSKARAPTPSPRPTAALLRFGEDFNLKMPIDLATLSVRWARLVAAAAASSTSAAFCCVMPSIWITA